MSFSEPAVRNDRFWKVVGLAICKVFIVWNGTEYDLGLGIQEPNWLPPVITVLVEREQVGSAHLVIMRSPVV